MSAKREIKDLFLGNLVKKRSAYIKISRTNKDVVYLIKEIENKNYVVMVSDITSKPFNLEKAVLKDLDKALAWIDEKAEEIAELRNCFLSIGIVEKLEGNFKK